MGFMARTTFDTLFQPAADSSGEFEIEDILDHHLRAALAVCCAVQHAILHSTAQHPCALQYNATPWYNIYLALYWQHLWDNFVKTTWV